MQLQQRGQQGRYSAMPSRTLLFAFVAAAAVVLSAVPAAATYHAGTQELQDLRYAQDKIRCKVCYRAIEHVWKKGVELRAHCQDEGTDPRCDFSRVHSFGIEEMAHAVCEDLPRTHAAIHAEGFDLVLDEAPDHIDHTDEQALAIRHACDDWLHDEHSIETVALYIFANLDAGKATEVVLSSLQHRFCKAACDPDRKKLRDRHDRRDEL